MTIVPAKSFDIPEIMQIERNAFIPAIQENNKTFEERLSVFPEGFLLFQENGKTAGYLTSEIWTSIPQNDDFFALNHSTKNTHNKNGNFLYVSSFALFSDYRGKGIAFSLFKESLFSLCASFQNIKKVVLLVNSEWKGAHHIYEKCGFTEIRKVKDFFPSLHSSFSDGILMECSADTFRVNL